MSKKKKSGEETLLRWRCEKCGAISKSTSDPIELAQINIPVCYNHGGGCYPAMSLCETDLQPILKTLRLSTFILSRIIAGNAEEVKKAMIGAAKVVPNNIKMLVDYGEYDQWMEEFSRE